MKTCALILLFLLSGCAVNITADSFIYQDDEVEAQVDLAQIRGKVTHNSILINISEVALTTQEGSVLKGVKLLRQDAVINIVFFGGSGMKISQSAGILNQFALLPVNVIWFDYRGVGVSEKNRSITVADLQNDALNIFDFANKNLPENIPTAIHGLSMGSLLASYIASERTIDGLILDGAISTVPELVEQVVPSWSKLFSTVTVSPELAEINNVELIKGYSKPLLFLAGSEDNTTPVKFAQELYEAAKSQNKTLAIIPDTKHGQTMKKPQAIKAYSIFIENITCCKTS